MKVDQWFKLWLARHMARHPRTDWPRLAEDPHFYSGWQGNFVVVGLTEDVADEVSVRLMADPPAYRSEHVKATVDLGRKIFAERAMAGREHDPESREAATAASVGCEDCGGASGLTVRWRKHSAGHPHGPTIALYCRCPLGRWVEKDHRVHAPEVRKRIHDLADHPFLYGQEYRVSPECWDSFNNRPMTVTPDEMKARLAADKARPGSTAPARRPEGAFRPEDLPPEVRAIWEHPRAEPEPATELKEEPREEPEPEPEPEYDDSGPAF